MMNIVLPSPFCWLGIVLLYWLSFLIVICHSGHGAAFTVVWGGRQFKVAE